MPRARTNAATAEQQVSVHLLEPVKAGGKRHEAGSTIALPATVAEGLFASGAALPSDEAPPPVEPAAAEPAPQADLLPAAQ